MYHSKQPFVNKMKKLVALALLLSIGTTSTFAQYKAVNFDYEKNYFNQGQALPAEDYFMVSGNVNNGIDLVEVEVHRSGKIEKNNPLYATTWKRSFNNTGQTFELPMNYKLRGNSEYDFVISTYRKASQTEKDNLQQILNSSLDAYVDGVISIERRRLAINKPTGSMVEDLNDIVRSGTQFYVNKINFNFPGFSDIVKNKIKQLKEAKLRGGLFNFSKKEADTRRDARRMYGEKLVGELKTALHTELEQMINTEMMVLSDKKEVRDYPTEKTRNVLAINAGYGGVYFSGGLNDLAYDSAPYVGLSFPLGKAAMSKTFWRNTSISAGVFLEDFTDEYGNQVTGPIFGRPYYLGLGYRAFQFIRINAGATFLENAANTTIDVSNISVKPFVGISAEINLWMGLGNGRPK